MNIVGIREFSRMAGITLHAVQMEISLGRIRLTPGRIYGNKPAPGIDADVELPAWQERHAAKGSPRPTRREVGKGDQPSGHGIREEKDGARGPGRLAQDVLGDDNVPGDDGEDIQSGPLTSNSSFASARRATEVAKAQKAELDLQERRGELVRYDKVQALFFDLASQVQKDILNIPGRIAGVLAAETEQFRVSTLLTQELKWALQALSEGKFELRK